MQQPKSRSARHCAAAILTENAKQKSSVKPIFDRTVKQFNLPSNERNLAMQLVYGVLRQRQFLERIVTLLSRTPWKKIDPFIRQALLVGLYQIFFLDRIPPSAAVNEAVESVKAAGIHKRLHGFVNGILRQAVRTRNDLHEQAKHDENGREILNHPQWLVERWIRNFGREETSRFCRTNNSEPTLTLRVNTSRTELDAYLRQLQEAGIVAEKGGYAAESLVLPEFSGSPAALPGYREGFFQVQDEAAQLATTLLEPFVRGGRYLDACAGLGGKTSHILQLAAELETTIHAVEPEPFRIEKLQENIERLFTSPSLVIHKASFLELGGDDMAPFDGILIDAPCSGTGVTGRHPDIRWNREEADLLKYQDLQYALISHAPSLLKRGGILVYATCSLEPEENEAVVTRFLENHKDFQLEDCGPVLPAEARGLSRNGCFHPLPSRTIDGFFAARLRKKS